MECYCGKDITDALNRHLSDIEEFYLNNRFTDSMNHGMQWGFWGIGTDGWDFATLYENSVDIAQDLESKHGKNDLCKNTVAIAGHCYRIAEVNYILWGKLMQLRNRKYKNTYEKGEFLLIRIYRSVMGIVSKIQTGEEIQSGTDGRLFWATVGLHSEFSLPENLDAIYYQFPPTVIPYTMYSRIGVFYIGVKTIIPSRIVTREDVCKSDCIVDESDIFYGSLQPWIHDKNQSDGYFRFDD